MESLGLLITATLGPPERQIVIVEMNTSYVFVVINPYFWRGYGGQTAIHNINRMRKTITDRDNLGDGVIDVLERIRWLTGVSPKKVVFQLRGYIGLRNPDNPIRAYLRSQNTEWVPTDPLMREPGYGSGEMFNILSSRVEAAVLDDSWTDGWRYAVSAYNRTPDIDGLTPINRFFHKADARGLLYFNASYLVRAGDQVEVGKFIGYDSDGMSYEFRLSNGSELSTKCVNPTPLPDTTTTEREASA